MAELPEIEGLAIHLDAYAIEGLNDGDMVAQWNDLSGNNYHATQGTDAKKPIYKTNILDGKPVVRFDGSDDQLNFGGGALGILRNKPGVTLFAVVNYHTLSGRTTVFYCTTPAGLHTTRFEHGANATPNYRLTGRRLDTDSWKTLSFGTPVADTFVLQTSRLDHSSNHAEIFVGGVSQGSDSFLGTGNTSDTDSDSMMLGRVGDYAYYFDGDLAEILVYDRALSVSDRQGVEQYLGEKWLGWSPPAGGARSHGYIMG